ncbi:hypothetical protein M0638_16615 [Roseomonas sp. NAR14]|uniref:Uncharacterized protein n=1 Tax=Roseomonas acroporae TaxID=2937791 RepID=A0A9X1YGT3_9PROT|nr:hypothetical protein [Roseomonas acroporae]MCK8786001.1 hypothetical protein [Roseomonas acroporae]
MRVFLTRIEAAFAGRCGEEAPAAGRLPEGAVNGDAAHQLGRLVGPAP